MFVDAIGHACGLGGRARAADALAKEGLAAEFSALSSDVTAGAAAARIVGVGAAELRKQPAWPARKRENYGNTRECSEVHGDTPSVHSPLRWESILLANRHCQPRILASYASRRKWHSHK